MTSSDSRLAGSRLGGKGTPTVVPPADRPAGPFLDLDRMFWRCHGCGSVFRDHQCHLALR